MRAAQFADGEFRVTEVADPPALGPGQLRIAVAACGICGSDLSMSKDPCRFVAVAEKAGYPLAVFDHQRPVVLGHEYAGTVVDTGADVTDFAIGDRVAGIGVSTDTGTGVPTIIGYSNEYHGGFGEFIVVDAFWVRHVPDGLSLEHATLAEPLHVGEMHVQQSGLTDADSALVIGCGPIGLGAILAAKAHGARTVIASEPSPARRALARALGADVVVDPNEQDPPYGTRWPHPARGSSSPTNAAAVQAFSTRYCTPCRSDPESRSSRQASRRKPLSLWSASFG
ncbi:alcohol dehydrogenase catalytic domain-containing protein [Nocardia sp. NPDC059180]|uniref:alcohol dehydrogenase catalytic domain-containing protein n=1 Tax=Nocardia sp. NPDC059180 TaxID=3346761 RepID=UPI0036B892CE